MQNCRLQVPRWREGNWPSRVRGSRKGLLERASSTSRARSTSALASTVGSRVVRSSLSSGARIWASLRGACQGAPAWGPSSPPPCMGWKRLSPLDSSSLGDWVYREGNVPYCWSLNDTVTKEQRIFLVLECKYKVALYT